MASETVTLVDGWKIGDTTHTTLELGEYGLDDLFAAQDAAEKVALHPVTGQPVLVISDAILDRELIARQVKRVGDQEVTVTVSFLGRALSPRDYAAVREKAQLLDQVIAAALQEGIERGRSSSPSQEDPPRGGGGGE